jgi:hypothetical protein
MHRFPPERKWTLGADNFPRHLFGYLGISRKRLYELAQPTWKLEIRFL